MKTDWSEREVSLLFDSYNDRVEERLGYRPMIARLVRDLDPAGIVLDYGCGSGKVSRRLVAAGIHDVRGVDISSTMIEKARAHPDQHGCSYRHITSARLPFEGGAFDAAVCCFVFINIHHQHHLSSVAEEIYRVLKPGGKLYIVDTNPDTVGIRFSTFQNGEPGQRYANGDERPVYLDIPDQAERFKIIDNHWTRKTYFEVLATAGFGEIDVRETRAGDVDLAEPFPSGAEYDHSPFVAFTASKIA